MNAAEAPSAERTPALCGHYEVTECRHCDDPLTRRYAKGWRCVLHAPGATELTCPHGIAWAEPCKPCAAIWGDPLDGGTMNMPGRPAQRQPDGPESIGGPRVPAGPVSRPQRARAAQQPPLLCPCGARSHGLAVAHCGACHLTFGSITGFDAHRIGPADTRRCRTAGEMAEMGYELSDLGIWRIPRPPGALPRP